MATTALLDQDLMLKQPLINRVVRLSRRYEAISSASVRKRRGQFFTPPSIAAFMAGQFEQMPERINLLDAGAGTGMLTAALCERIASCSGRHEVHVTLYEDCPEVIPFLTRAMALCKQHLVDNGHGFTYTIVEHDFILANEDVVRLQRSLFALENDQRFDLALLNPPYYKLNRDAPQVAIMEPVVHGQPNIYALFMAMAAALLRDGGQLVAITPRSYCNGLYFRSFRRWFFQRMQPRALHIFGSRTDAFQEDNVLQENIILVCDQVDTPRPTVRITRSKGRDLTGPLDACEIPFAQIVDDSHHQMTIRVPEQRLDAEIVSIVDDWPCTFSGLGLAISTGPVVSFRARLALLDAVDSHHYAAPMLWMHNVRPFVVRWPLKAKGKAEGIEISSRTAHLLLPTENYVILKRFSAKEERRRMTAGVLLADDFPADQVGIENHLNYIYRRNGELTPDEAFGVAGLLNSAFLDRYFRTMSGNTQVNATEIRTMPMPSLERIRAIGEDLRHQPQRDETTVEQTVLTHLGINGSLAAELLGQCR